MFGISSVGIVADACRVCFLFKKFETGWSNRFMAKMIYAMSVFTLDEGVCEVRT